MKKYPQVEGTMKHVNEYYEKEGSLKFGHLVGNSYIHVARNYDPDDNIIEPTWVVQEDTDQCKIITYGQHNVHDELHGIGRKIRVWSK